MPMIANRAPSPVTLVLRDGSSKTLKPASSTSFESVGYSYRPSAYMPPGLSLSRRFAPSQTAVSTKF
jgi:hypothetical protein